MNHIRQRAKIHSSNTIASSTPLQQHSTHSTCRGYLGSGPHYYGFYGEGSRNFELAPIILGDVENVDVVHCEESVTGLQIKADVIVEDQPQSIFTNCSFADVIVSHTGAK